MPFNLREDATHADAMGFCRSVAPSTRVVVFSIQSLFALLLVTATPQVLSQPYEQLYNVFAISEFKKARAAGKCVGAHCTAAETMFVHRGVAAEALQCKDCDNYDIAFTELVRRFQEHLPSNLGLQVIGIDIWGHFTQANES